MRVTLRVVAALLLTAVVAVAIAWLAGTFRDKVDGSTSTSAIPTPLGRPVGDAVLAPVHVVRVPLVEPVIGSVRAVHETAVASRLLAAVLEIPVRGGDRVEAGDVVARLDDEALRARVRQADADLETARAVLDRAVVGLERSASLLEQGVASQAECDDATTAVRTARSAVERAERALDEFTTALRHATVRAPMSGVVVERKVEPGDTVAPGQTIVTVYDPDHMQLVAGVRESLSRHVAVGDTIAVRIDALDLLCEGTISEIVPRAEEASRTLDVKVTGPCPPGVYSGMFGRMLVPLGEEEVLVAPAAAVRRVGQLRLVDVVEGDRLVRRAVRPGREFGADVEILAGLRAGERVALAE